jgi:hypothetical protein
MGEPVVEKTVRACRPDALQRSMNRRDSAARYLANEQTLRLVTRDLPELEEAAGRRDRLAVVAVEDRDVAGRPRGERR